MDTQMGSLPISAAMWLDLTVKATLILLAGALIGVALRRASAAARHFVWTLVLGSLLVLPLLAASLPGWQLPLLPPLEPAPSDSASGTGTATETSTGVSSLPIPDAHRREPREVFSSSAPAADGPRPISNDQKQIIKEEGPEETTSLPTAVAIPPTPERRFDWLPVIWVIGAVLVVSRLFLGLAGLWWATRRADRVDDPAWILLIRDLTAEIGLSRRVVLLRSRRATMPMTWSLLRSVILLPVDAESWSPERRRVVLLHEMAHVKRRDCLTQMLAQLTCGLYWFHPLVWLASRKLRVERELACDDQVLSVGSKASDYAWHLLEIARSFRPVRSSALAAVAMARPSQLEGRLLAILDARRNRRGIRPIGAALASLAVATVVLPLAALRPWARAEEPRAEDKQVTKKIAATEDREPRSVSGVVRDSMGKPVAGANVYWLAPLYLGTATAIPKKSLPSQTEAELLQIGKTDDQGRFSLQAQFKPGDRRVTDRMTMLVAKAPKNSFGGLRYAPDTKKVEVVLGAEVPIEGRLLAPNGSPAKGVRVRMVSSRRTISIVPEDGWGIGSPVMWQGKEYKIPDFPEPVVTDDKGRFTLGGLVQGGDVQIETTHDNFAPAELEIASNSKLTEWLVKSIGKSDVLQPKFTHTLEPARAVQGVITDKETGQPLADVLVEVTIWRVQNGAHGGRGYYARTDAQGRYRLLGPLPNDTFMAYSFAVHPAPESGYLPVEGAVPHPLPAGQKVVEKSFALPKGTILRGKIIDGDSKKPIAGAAIVYEPKSGNPNNPGDLQFYRHPASSDDQGNFAVTGLRGEGYLLVEGPSPDYVRSILSQGETKTGRDRFLHGFAKIDVKDQSEPSRVEIGLRKGIALEVRAVKPDGSSLPWVSALCRGIGANVNWVHGLWHAQGCDKGRLRLTGLDPARTYRIFLIHAESRLAAVAEVRADPKVKQPVEIRLQPTAKVRGRVINPDGSPAAQCSVNPHMLLTGDKEPVTRDDFVFGDRVISQINFEQRMFNSLTRWRANAKGEFEFDSLMPGVRIFLQAGTSDNKEAIKEVTLKPGEVRDIGTLTLEKRKE